jgi:hypothetical protein
VSAHFLFPVGSWSGVCAAVFFTERDARNFINAELPHRNLYEGVPNYDRRERGYRYEPAAFTEVHGDPFLNAKAA